MILYKTIYQIQYTKDEPRTYIRWDGSAKDAGSARKKIRKAFGFIPNSVKTTKIDLLSNKIALLQFLNSGELNNTYSKIIE